MNENTHISASQLAEELRSLIAGTGGIAPAFDPKAHFYDELGIPSVKALHLLYALEDKYNVHVEDEEFINANTLETLQAMMSRLIGMGA
jgi:acyl carrier protein